jgi:hypothetical protein
VARLRREMATGELPVSQLRDFWGRKPLTADSRQFALAG